MREQNFSKIKKTAFILLGVFFVVAVTAASASACASSDHKEKIIKVEPAKVVDPKAAQEAAQKAAQAAAQEKLGNQLLDMVQNDWFGNGGGSDSDNGWEGDSDNSWGGDSDNGWEGASDNSWGGDSDNGLFGQRFAR